MTLKLLTFFVPALMYVDWARWFANGADLIVIFVAVYALIKLTARTRALPTAVGFLSFSVACWLFQRYVPTNLGDIIRWFLAYLPIFAVILFLPEIRLAFMTLGMKMSIPGPRKIISGAYEEIVLAATTLASTKTGALIVIERGVGLKPFTDGGIRVDAEVSYDLLVSIFNTASPLHDGAVVIQGNRVAAASCFGPLSLNPRLSRTLGTRHRAAIGITEDTDAVVVVVSEETGLISFCQNGELRRGLDANKLQQALNKVFALPPVVRRSDADKIFELEE